MSGSCGKGVRMTFSSLLVLGAGVLTGFSGCGGGTSGEGAVEHPRADASGKVMFKGEPIPAGSVVFTHLETGTYSNCPISDGEYENEGGDGPIVGKNAVTITGLEGENGKALWSGAWSREVTIEGDEFTQDFDVKAEEVQPYKDTGMDEEGPLYE